MKYASVTSRLAGLGGAKWAVHVHARELKAKGRDIIELTIGEPDVPTPDEMKAALVTSLMADRTGYSNGRGEPGLVAALGARYSQRLGRPIGADRFMCLPGTQTSLYVTLMGLLDPGDEVIIGDPMYATYQGLIAAPGGRAIALPLPAEKGFHLQADDIARAITPRTRAIFLNSPHNPTGAVLTRDEVGAIGELARAHDLWIISDEVYEDLIFPGQTFTSPLAFPEFEERTVAVSSISKSHAAPGFRSGWAVGPAEFIQRLVPLSETMLFGSQPFIADMTEAAILAPSPVAGGMVERFARRAALLHERLHHRAGLAVHRPAAGMFALVDVRATGLSGEAFAMSLLEEQSVAVMPGESFGSALGGWVRISLTQPDTLIGAACDRIVAHAQSRREAA